MASPATLTPPGAEPDTDRDLILSCRDVVKTYGGLTAVNHASIGVRRGSVTGLVGPNGAGKTTMLNIISGFERLDRGTITFDGHDISRLGAHQSYRHGLVRTFQVPRPVPTMSVIENLVLAGTEQAGERVWNTWFRPGRVADDEDRNIDRALWALEYVDLIHLRDEYAANLSGGQKKLLEFARTLMAEPKMVLLDEPGAGVNRTLMQHLMRRIEDQADNAGITFLIVEHDMDVIARLCDPVIVMSQGAPIFEGSFTDMTRDQQVLDAYLGSQYR